MKKFLAQYWIFLLALASITIGIPVLAQIPTNIQTKPLIHINLNAKYQYKILSPEGTFYSDEYTPDSNPNCIDLSDSSILCGSYRISKNQS